ncbi:MAG: prephenate dehydrogenase/arogenate dehydrogenase family protein [Desulfuromonadaceae bacterium]|nr:prephenate dehydrogenase/arogenate dehydrogenase family protein [Desulfuromonas sp.]MDY0185228.1 prephenate dehydrogenase/arogenate dehydrogenase family protein [Desulfuromonadaceae bacterium]
MHIATHNKEVIVEQIAIIGAGLIGGSLALALKQAGSVGEVVVWDQNPAHMATAITLGIADRSTLELTDAVVNADVVVLALPVCCLPEVARRVIPYMRDDAILTDTGSVKGTIVEGIEPVAHAAGIAYVPGHPISGTEKSGPQAAFAELYRAKRCILTPTALTPAHGVEVISQLWRSAGSEVVLMDVLKHDRILAAISHLPHMIAYSLVNAVSNYDQYAENVLEYSAGGFRDFTRIASSDPVMWRDIALENRSAILEMLEQFETFLAELKADIAGQDAERLEKFFRQSKLSRDAIVYSSGSPAKGE